MVALRVLFTYFAALSTMLFVLAASPFILVFDLVRWLRSDEPFELVSPLELLESNWISFWYAFHINSDDEVLGCARRLFPYGKRFSHGR